MHERAPETYPNLVVTYHRIITRLLEWNYGVSLDKLVILSMGGIMMAKYECHRSGIARFAIRIVHAE